MPKFQTQAKLSSFSRSKLNPITVATQIQPKTREEKVEPKAEREREREEGDGYRGGGGGACEQS